MSRASVFGRFRSAASVSVAVVCVVARATAAATIVVGYIGVRGAAIVVPVAFVRYFNRRG